jgi:hypothetical protein
MPSQSLAATWQKVPLPDFSLNPFRREERSSLGNQKGLGFDPDRPPSQLIRHRGYDTEPAPPFQEQITLSELQFANRCQGPPNVSEIASHILLNRLSMPSIPIGLEQAVGSTEQYLSIQGNRSLEIPCNVDGCELFIASGWRISAAWHSVSIFAVSNFCLPDSRSGNTIVVYRWQRNFSGVAVIFSPHPQSFHPPKVYATNH